MAVHGGFVVDCDEPECDRQVSGGLRTKSEAIWHARRFGWAIGKDSALCPVHRTRKLVTHEFEPAPNGQERSCWKHGCWKHRDHAVHGPAR